MRKYFQILSIESIKAILWIVSLFLESNMGNPCVPFGIVAQKYLLRRRLWKMLSSLIISYRAKPANRWINFPFKHIGFASRMVYFTRYPWSCLVYSLSRSIFVSESNKKASIIFRSCTHSDNIKTLLNLKYLTPMKTFKTIISIVLLSLFVYSCTPQNILEENNVETYQTGDESHAEPDNEKDGDN